MNQLITYSLSMIILPIMGYFVANVGFNFYTSEHWANIYAAVVAVVIVHCVLFSLVYQAYNEERTLEKDKVEKED